jgi:hypothetical protein
MTTTLSTRRCSSRDVAAHAAVRADTATELGHGYALHAEHAEHAAQVPRGGREGEGKGKGVDWREQEDEGRLRRWVSVGQTAVCVYETVSLEKVARRPPLPSRTKNWAEQLDLAEFAIIGSENLITGLTPLCARAASASEFGASVFGCPVRRGIRSSKRNVKINQQITACQGCRDLCALIDAHAAEFNHAIAWRLPFESSCRAGERASPAGSWSEN